MRMLLAIAMLGLTACNAGPDWVTLTLNVTVGDGRRVIDVGGFQISEWVTEGDRGMVALDRRAGTLSVGSVRPLRLRVVTEPAGRVPALQAQVVELGEHDAVAVGVERRSGENRWTVHAGASPAYPIGCRRAGAVIRCGR